ncbi:MAG: sigma-70 family RNA polymerase sigma factor [Chloroflexi bacterium]|nr:sigma-70 family RNA polymerase sigma factor [Chloroflexota bacterium]MBP8058100.1 sigma-70 family RNA polymerase sigma factor [Chloroflexota bacterium]
MTDTDAILLQRARTFDRRALADIYETYHPLIYSYVFRRVGDVEHARDLTAEVFKHLLQTLRQGGGPDQSLRAWLYRTAHNQVIDHYRRQQFRQHQTLAEEWQDAAAEPGHIVEQEMTAQKVRQALHTLTPIQQEVIALKFLEGWSNEEVATLIERPIGAVKSLQHRALATLQRYLSPLKEKVRL